MEGPYLSKCHISSSHYCKRVAYLFLENKTLAFARNRIENPTHSFLAISLFCGVGGSWHYFALSFLEVLGNNRQDEVCRDRPHTRGQGLSHEALLHLRCDSVRVPRAQGFPNHSSSFCTGVGLEQVLIGPHQNSTCPSEERKTPLFLATPGSCCTLHTQGKFTREEHACYNM